MSWANFDDVERQLLSAGLILKEGMQVGTHKPVRCHVEGLDREKRGWYWLSDIPLDDGNGGQAFYIVGSFGVYSGNDNGKHKVTLAKNAPALSDDQRQAIKARHAENIKRAKAIRDAEAERAARKAAYVWSKYVPTGESDYLARKGVGAHGLRFHPSGNGTMAVPMLDTAGKVWALQIIRGKDRGKKLEKEYFPKGLSKQGHFHLLGAPGQIVLIAEGYATAATLFEATMGMNLAVAVAFDANGLLPVASEIHKRYPRAHILLCADDDYLTDGNPGVKAAQAAALAVGGKTLIPLFSADREGKKITDFNDLAQIEGIHAVRIQVESSLRANGWEFKAPSAGALNMGGEGKSEKLISMLTVDEAAQRYALIYGMGGDALFDRQEGRIVHKKDLMNLLPRHGWEQLREHPGWEVVRDTEVGFDPTEKDPSVRLNLFRGWPTKPVAGECEHILALLEYLCSNEKNSREINQWILKWLAYPIQHRGAKMHSAIVVHGPQGTGKSRFFEAYGRIFGEYGMVLGQEALEDKFNADWAEKKLFILADEVLARGDMFHIKNRLKGFITGEWIRVNPKNVAAHRERNQMNIVFLSNEKMPTVLENDDRRHCIVWTPPKLSDEFFHQVNDEIENGGVAALHHFLLNLDLGDFKPWTKPPMTEAKQDLIDLGMGSEERFSRDWASGELGVPFCPCGSMDLYRLYKKYCTEHGITKPRESNHFINSVVKQQGWENARKKIYSDLHFSGEAKHQRMIVPSATAMEESKKRGGKDYTNPEGLPAGQWMTRCFFDFQNAVNDA